MGDLSDIERIDLGRALYEEAVERMTGWVERRRAGAIRDRPALLGHPPVITHGTRTPPAELPADSRRPLRAAHEHGDRPRPHGSLYFRGGPY